jgi:hypothetical protein
MHRFKNMTEVLALARRLWATLSAHLLVLTVFVLTYLALLAIFGFVLISYFERIDPNWDEGPGGIILLPVYVLALPFAIWFTVFVTKRCLRSKRP